MRINDDLTLNSEGLKVSLVRLAPFWRLLFGITGISVLAYYIPLLIVTLTGLWVNRVLMFPDVLIEVGILAIVSVIGYAFKNIWLVALVVLGIYLGYEIQHYVRAPMTFEIGLRWPEFFAPSASLILNAWLTRRYVRSVELQD